MLKLVVTNRFKKDMKRLKKQGKDHKKLQNLLDMLVNGQPLPKSYHRHRLSGDRSPAWECHIEPDWLLIWEEDETSITLVRMGSHSDLFC